MRKCIIVLALLVTAIMFANVPAAFAASFTETELAYIPATRLVELFKTGEVTPTQVLEAQIARVIKYNGQIKADSRDLLDDPLAWNGKVNAICFERFEEARKAAREAEKRYKNGTNRPLEGITVGVKNENHVVGWRVDMGSILLKDEEPCTDDAAIIDKLREAGAIFVFSTTVPEHYVSSMTWSKLYGVSRNPWNEYYGTGGSSGGSGAALAAGFCTLATGSDIGGSIRLPSSMCGVYGFKAPFGRVPTSDVVYETLGPMARTFDDLVLMQNVICGSSPKVYTSLPRIELPSEYDGLRGAKIAVMYMDKYVDGGIDPDVRAGLDGVVKTLRGLGAQVDVVDSSWRMDVEHLKVYLNGLMSGAMALTVDTLRASDQITPYMRNVIELSDGTGNAGKAAIDALAKELHSDVQTRVFTQGYTALIMPTLMTPHVPADVDASDAKNVMLNGRRLPNSMMNCATMYWNVLYTYPVVDVPVAISSRSVPIGVQVVGNTYDDVAAFRVASALSKALPQNFTGNTFPDFRNEK